MLIFFSKRGFKFKKFNKSVWSKFETSLTKNNHISSVTLFLHDSVFVRIHNALMYLQSLLIILPTWDALYAPDYLAIIANTICSVFPLGNLAFANRDKTYICNGNYALHIISDNTKSLIDDTKNNSDKGKFDIGTYLPVAVSVQTVFAKCLQWTGDNKPVSKGVHPDKRLVEY